MEHRAFTPDHFRMFHPGGKLGARLLKVRDLMHDDPPLVAEALGMGDTLLEITRRGFGVVGVTDAKGDLAGIITDGDLRRHLDGLMQHKAGEVMTPNPRTIGPDALAGEALALMNDRKITCLLVTEADSRRAIGILHVHDCLRAGVA
jgi:arabinose-5-phosphate isomerase